MACGVGANEWAKCEHLMVESIRQTDTEEAEEPTLKRTIASTHICASCS